MISPMLSIGLPFGFPCFEDTLDVAPAPAVACYGLSKGIDDPGEGVLILRLPKLLCHQRRQQSDILLIQSVNVAMLRWLRHCPQTCGIAPSSTSPACTLAIALLSRIGVGKVQVLRGGLRLESEMDKGALSSARSSPCLSPFDGSSPPRARPDIKSRSPASSLRVTNLGYPFFQWSFQNRCSVTLASARLSIIGNTAVKKRLGMGVCLPDLLGNPRNSGMSYRAATRAFLKLVVLWSK